MVTWIELITVLGQDKLKSRFDGHIRLRLLHVRDRERQVSVDMGATVRVNGCSDCST